MKIREKLTALVLAGLLAITSITSFATGSPIELTIDGILVEHDTNGSPCTIFNLDGQTFAAVRPILEFLDFEVNWQRVDGKDRVDALSPGEVLPTATVPGIFVDGIQLPPDSNGNPAIVIKQDNRVFVPIRALLEYLGLTVEWEDNNIIASTPKSPNTLEGTVSDILASLISETDTRLDDANKMPFAFANDVSVETAQGILGLSPEQFNEHVAEATVSVAAIGTFAHQVALIKCTDSAAAAEVKALVAAGFDATRWICVFPEQCFVIEAGDYVLMAATTNARANALLEAFVSMADTTGEVDIFFNGK